MAVDTGRKVEFFAAVKRHMATVGSTNWNDVLDQFEDIPISTRWRWIREVKGADPSRPELINAKAKIAQKIKKVGQTDRFKEMKGNGTQPIAEHLPAAPSPNYIARTGEQGLQNLDFVAEIYKLYADAQMLRAYGIKMKPNEDGEMVEAIHNPAAFDKSIVRRASLLETAIKAVQEVWDLRTMQAFYQTIIEEIGQESPETQRRIMERLAALNAKQGFTLSMKV